MANDGWTLEYYMKFKEIWPEWVEYFHSEKQCALSQLDIKTLQHEINDGWRSKIKPT